jgi:hypothetical protein
LYQQFSNVIDGLFRFQQKKGFGSVLAGILAETMLFIVTITNARASLLML